jgi:ABC-type glycerol-3-phosphate transport system substrate-binding protein
MFLGGQGLAIYSNNVANVTLFKKPIGDKFKWGVQPWPKGPSGSRGATVHVNVTHLTSQAKNPQDAWAFLKLICSHEAGVEKVLMNSGSPGARPDVWGDKRLWDFEPWYQKGLAIMGEATAPHMAYNLKTPEVDNVLIQRTAEIWLNKISPSDGAEQMTREIQAILDQPR